MGFTWKMYVVLTVFFVACGVVYGFLTDFSEPVGFAGLLMVGGLAVMTAFYLRAVQKDVGGVRPEDDPEAPVEAEAGEQGVFLANSWWPLGLAASGALVAIGLAIGYWICVGGVVLGIISIVAYALEMSTGEYAH